MKAKDVIINTEGKIGKVVPPEGQGDPVPYLRVTDMVAGVLPCRAERKGGKTPRG